MVAHTDWKLSRFNACWLWVCFCCPQFVWHCPTWDSCSANMHAVFIHEVVTYWERTLLSISTSYWTSPKCSVTRSTWICTWCRVWQDATDITLQIPVNPNIIVAVRGCNINCKALSTLSLCLCTSVVKFCSYLIERPNWPIYFCLICLHSSWGNFGVRQPWSHFKNSASAQTEQKQWTSEYSELLIMCFGVTAQCRQKAMCHSWLPSWDCVPEDSIFY